jgi:hypothetical protein
VFVHDDGCQALFLVVQPSPSSHKSWCYKFRRARTRGAAEKIFLGPFDPSDRPPAAEPKAGQPLTLAEARLIAIKLTNARKMGKDIGLEARSKKLDEIGANSFVACCRDHITRHVSGTRSRRETTRLLGFDLELEPVRGGLAQRWAERPVTSITEDELWQVIDQSRDGIGGTSVKKRVSLESRARKMHSALSVMFGWLKAKRRKGQSHAGHRASEASGGEGPDAQRDRDQIVMGGL